MADDLVTDAAQTETLVPPSALAPKQAQPVVPHRPPLYGKRFALAYALLAVVLGTAAGLAVVLADADPKATGGPWAEWAPPSEGTTPRMREIAEFVSSKYRLDSGRQLVAVNVGRLAVPTEGDALAVTDIAIRSGPEKGDTIDVETGNGAWMFQMCGLGENCSISEGEASTDRHRLLRREALELALYSFRYVSDVEAVIAFLPPHPEAQTGSAVYLRRSDLEAQLDAPLRTTLLPLNRVTQADLPPAETELVDQLTASRVYTFDFQRTPTGGVAMILDPAV